MLQFSKIVKLLTNPHFLSIFALLFFSIFALKSLTTPGFYTSHDGETHTARIAQYFIALKDLQIPPRHARSFYSGLGSPIFVYIYPLPYLLGSAVHGLGFSFANSFKIMMALGFIASALFTYLWLFQFFKNPKAAFLGALFYTWVPYRFSLIYVRASISEFLAYTFLPLVFYALTLLSRKKSPRWIALSAVAISLLLLSQNLVSVIIIPIIASYVVIFGFLEKSLKYLLTSTLAFFWGLAIASISYLPSLLELKFVRFNEIIVVAYTTHFVTLGQLIRSPWGYGFDIHEAINGGMSFQIGLAHLLIFGLTILIISYFFVKKFSFVRRIGQIFLDEIDINSLVFALFFTAVFIIAIILMLDTKYTRFIWDHFRVLHIIDIPWRFLGICSLATAFLAGFVARYIKSGLILLILIFVVLIANRNHLRINQALPFDDNHFLNYAGTATQFGEFTPKSRQTTQVPIGFDANQQVKVIEGQASLGNVSSKSNLVSFPLDVTSQTARILISKFYFPKTIVYIDNKKLEAFKDFQITDSSNLKLDTEKDTSGLILLDLSRGHHFVKIQYRETQLRLFADFLSLISFLVALGFILKYAKK